MELTKPANWDSMSQAAKKIIEKEAGEAQGEYAPLSPKKHYGGRLPACAARASRHKPARIAVFADRGAATRRPRADKERPAT